MMRASKKALANNIKVVTDKDIEKAYIQDMLGKEIATTKVNKVAEEQKAKYLDFVSNKLMTFQSEFLIAMKTKMIKGEELTPNMVAALDRMIAKEAVHQTKKDEPVDESKLPKITCKVRQWWMKEHKLDSRVISGVILQESHKAYLIKGHADMAEGLYCMRCGRELTEPASMLIGFGETCCEKLGIPYPADVKTASVAERKAIRKKLLKVLHNQKFETWVPKSQIEEIIALEGRK